MKAVNNGKIRLLLVLYNIGLVIALFWASLSAAGYKIEIELGRSLEPVIGVGAILIVSQNPDYIREGDIVSVVSGRNIDFASEVRKLVVDCERDLLDEEVYIHLMDGSKTVDWGWFPVWAVRSKVVCILFRGFVREGGTP